MRTTNYLMFKSVLFELLSVCLPYRFLPRCLLSTGSLLGNVFCFFFKLTRIPWDNYFNIVFMAGLFQIDVALPCKNLLNFCQFSTKTEIFKNAALFHWGHLMIKANGLLNSLPKAASMCFPQPLFFVSLIFWWLLNFHQSSAQNFSCSATSSQWIPGFPGHSDAAGVLRPRNHGSQKQDGRNHWYFLQEPRRHSMDETWIGLNKSYSWSNYKSAQHLCKPF